MKAIQRIPQDDQYVTGRDYAQRDKTSAAEGVVLMQPTHVERIQALAARNVRKGVIDHAPTGKVKGSVQARIDFERWIADCPDPDCHGAEMVELDEPVFFCLSCGNARNKGDYYAVEFPSGAVREAIYAELEQRPVKRPPQQAKIARAELSRGQLHPVLTRSWSPGETPVDLKQQLQLIEEQVKLRKAK